MSGRPYSRRLDRNHTTRLPRKLVFVDTETNRVDLAGDGSRWANTFRLCCATFVRLEDGQSKLRYKKRFSSTADWWLWLESLQNPYTPIWVYAHNLAFDWRILGGWDQLDSGDYTVGPAVIAGRDSSNPKSRPWVGQMVLESTPFYLYLLGKRGRVNFVDSFNYYGRSLKSIGETQNRPK